MKRGCAVLDVLLLFVLVLFAAEGCQDDEEDDLYEYAQQFWDKKMYGLAAQNYEQFAFSNPGHQKAAKGLYKAAFVYAYYLADNLRAIELFHRLVVQYPDSPYRMKAHESLADIYETHLERYPQAIAQYQKIMELRARQGQDVSDCSYRMGRCYSIMGDNEHARDMYDRVLKESPGGEYADRAAYQIGYLHYLDGDFKEAEAALAFFVEGFPNSERAFDGMIHLARCLEKQGRDAEYRALIKKIKERFPTELARTGTKKKKRR